MNQLLFLFKRKSIWLLSAAALAIVFTGISLRPTLLHEKISAGLLTLFLVFFVYGLDGLSDHTHPFKVFRKPEGRILMGILLAAVACTFFLTKISVLCSVAILLLGFTYSFPFQLGTNRPAFLLKSFVGVKNLWIAFAWALLIYLGIGEFSSDSAHWTAVFVGIQVFIGSILRDVDDVEEDRTYHIQTIPHVIGVRPTYWALHILNFASGFLLLLAQQETEQKWFALLWGAVFWRTVNLEWLRQKSPGVWATQYMNLATCGVIFSLRLASYAVY